MSRRRKGHPIRLRQQDRVARITAGGVRALTNVRSAVATPSTLRVVALGGGTGLPILLRGLNPMLFPRGPAGLREWDRDRLTAVVTVADDGGSSGRLRQTHQVLPPGDIRNCLLALSQGHPTLAALFDFRFNGHGDVSGHSLGNLILTALSQMESDFTVAVTRAGEILGISGRVLPATLDDVTLVAELADGSMVRGESRIAGGRQRIRRVALQPAGARALPKALDAVASADLIVIGPGSLFTSLVPILLVEELATAIAQARARVVLVANVMTEPGETDGYAVSDFLATIRSHAPAIRIDYVLINGTPVPREQVQRYAAAGAAPISVDLEAVRRLGYLSVMRDLLGPGPKVLHDPDKLARAVVELATRLPR